VYVPVSEGEPPLGGILLWKDQQSFLRLERGPTGRNEISFGGYLDGEQHQIGRGRLLAERLFLRLERFGRRVNAFCSADGQQWFSVGQGEFPAGDAIQVGLYALGAIDRRVYPGAYQAGAAIRFESFQLWR
jgi:hypothetical protein